MPDFFHYPAVPSVFLFLITSRCITGFCCQSCICARERRHYNSLVFTGGVFCCGGHRQQCLVFVFLLVWNFVVSLLSWTLYAFGWDSKPPAVDTMMGVSTKIRDPGKRTLCVTVRGTCSWDNGRSGHLDRLERQIHFSEAWRFPRKHPAPWRGEEGPRLWKAPLGAGRCPQPSLCACVKINLTAVLAKRGSERGKCRRVTPIIASNFEYLPLRPVGKKNTN